MSNKAASSLPRLPAEWEPQAAVLMSWPQNANYWGTELAAVEHCLTTIGRTILAYQPLWIVAADAAHAAYIEQQLGADVQFVHAPTNDIWVRDYGPIRTQQCGQNIDLDFQFNGWGGKFPAELDNKINQQLQYSQFLSNCQQRPWILEGGSLDSNGNGSLLTTSQCLLNPNRNGPQSQQQAEAWLQAEFGLQQVHWLQHGHLAGDDTDAHIDTIARFINPNTILLQGCNDLQDYHYPHLQAMLEQSKSFKDLSGKPYAIHELPLPQAIHARDGTRLPASYANFLIINNAVLVPTYADPADEQVLEIFTALFPDRHIHGIDCQALIAQYGSLHCATMHIPA